MYIYICIRYTYTCVKMCAYIYNMCIYTCTRMYIHEAYGSLNHLSLGNSKVLLPILRLLACL